MATTSFSLFMLHHLICGTFKRFISSGHCKGIEYLSSINVRPATHTYTHTHSHTLSRRWNYLYWYWHRHIHV